MNSLPDPFVNPQVVASYAEGPPRAVPGYHALLTMVTILLGERVPDEGRVLVLGAGGGLELKAFAQARPHWSFDGVDPSAPMLRLAEETLGPLAACVHLHQGYIDAAPAGPFDGATCLLTFHFIGIEERRRIAREIRQRLKPHAPFVVAHLSIPAGEKERSLWLSRYSAFLVASGTAPDKATAAGTAVAQQLTLLTPEQDEAILREAGFSDVTLFYTGFTFRGWVAYAASPPST